MELALLLLVPLLIALFGWIYSAYKETKYYSISFTEFLTILGMVTALVGVGYTGSRYANTRDQEVQSGHISSKKKEWTACSHAYPCHPHPCGKDSTCWDVCFEHFNDWNWAVYTDNEESFKIQRVDRQGCLEPPRFTQVQVGEPSAQVHWYQNYIKGNPWSLFNRTSAVQKFKQLIPNYPVDEYDYYHVDRFLPMMSLPAEDIKYWNDQLAIINADIGKQKKVNIVCVVVSTADSSYYEALEQAWLGGKKNDVIIIFGVTQYPNIDWVRVLSWTRAEEMKIALRDQIQDIGTFEAKGRILEVIKKEVSEKFIHRPMNDFKYLLAGAKPPTWALVLIWILGVGLSGWLTCYFWENNPFSKYPSYGGY